MGAELWYHEAPWHQNTDEALKALQANFLIENYDLPSLLNKELANTREVVAKIESDSDQYGLLEIFQKKLSVLEAISYRPLPENTEAKIEIVRQIYFDTGEGIGNILDITGVSQKRSLFKTQQLSESEILEFTGSSKPKLDQAQNSIFKIGEVLGRGECVCFPFYSDGKPDGWYFVGSTID